MSSKNETLKHRGQVQKVAEWIMIDVAGAVMMHDESKLHEPELSIFNEYTPKLKNTTYGSDEYKEHLKQMGIGITHHQKSNRHHPEYFDNGIQGMDLVDFIEMFCDWWAASLRHDDGDIRRSIDINQKRFGYSDDMAALMRNTVVRYEQRAKKGIPKEAKS